MTARSTYRPDCGLLITVDAVPARAATPSAPSLFHVSGIAGMAIAAFCVVYFALQLVRGVH
jgi:hypothetical protein